MSAETVHTDRGTVDALELIEVDDPIFSVRDVSVTFDMDRGESRVLDDVSLDIAREEVLGVVGESGSGKSMFASALLDAVVDPGRVDGEITYYPDSGPPVDVLELGADELRRFRWEEVSMVFQGAQSSFNPVITIREHFEETINAHGREVGEAMAHARELIADLHMEPDRVLDSYPHELSGGMKQRTLIALSLVLEPNVLVMDEPTAALDLLMQRSILDLLENLKEKYNLTVVFITHDLPLVTGLSDRLAVLYAFEFVEIADADRIVDRPVHPYTRSLLKAVPNLNMPLAEMQPIEGSAPDPVNVPAGCSYHPRCPLADDQCRTDDPPLRETDEDAVAACFHWEDAPDAVPLDLDREYDPDEQTIVDGSQSERPVLSLEDVEVHFEQEKRGLRNFFSDPEVVRAVDGVDLDIYENDVVALVGESGCGKTTLGKAAIGAQRPTGGRVSYRDVDIWEARDQGDTDVEFDEIRRSLQMIHQDPGSSLNPNKTVRKSLESPLKLWKPDMDSADRNARILGMLEYVGMRPPEDYADRYPHQLSGGEQQRVALIRALLMNPDVILADEAVSALDVSLRVEMMDLMLELQEWFDTSYLFISHNLSNARYFAGGVGGRIGVMYLGEIIEIGPAEEIIQDPRHPYTKVLKWSTEDLDSDAEAGEPPVRGIDIPDPVDPPSGCRFHTRCPEAREICRSQCPSIDDSDAVADEHATACFREYGSDHPYWDSDSIVDEPRPASGTGVGEEASSD
ncbi:ABC transporter ATP-binding protein [Halopiger xanaduensis]|uniref:Oligopeptide/dipeptide ABC transporter, ATPase subunit n=1 Tax=Halopiger xanaduensis (strain DSM 18323 / JCM 14033 / SH-6) TaxID=797210 RepID=F8DDI5_HALXS|nr:ABC transporter ATP-binding protein [Halopiger xanaduensis]AEH39079.1 oligopeptide/dipeptide ABC transporter, ATPase subunit [Halopiger xanaduensis SH-6]